MFKHQNFFFFFLVSFLLIISFSVQAGTKTVFWGGVGFSGSWAERDIRFQYSSKLLCTDTSDCPAVNINSVAREKFINRNFKHLAFDKGLISTTAVEALVGVISINNEEIGITQYQRNGRKDFLHVFRIFANVLFYEVGSGKIVGSVPFVIRYSTYLPSSDDDIKKQGIIRALIFNNSLGLNLFDVAYERSKNFNPSKLPSKFTQVTKFSFSEQAKEKFGKNEQVLSAKFAQFFEGELAGKANASLIPSAAGGSVVAGKIKATFEDGERELSLPEAAFKVQVLVRLAKLYQKVRGPQKTVCHMVAQTLDVSTSLEQISKIKFALTKDACGVTSINQVFDPNFYFSRSLFSLLQGVASQFKLLNKDWLGRNARGNGDMSVPEEIAKIKKQVFDRDF